MSFLLECPDCGARSVYEFQYGGEVRSRPHPDASREAWIAYIYWKENESGVQKEWWYHRMGCRTWFVAERNASTNVVLRSYLPDAAPDREREGGSPPVAAEQG